MPINEKENHKNNNLIWMAERFISLIFYLSYLNAFLLNLLLPSQGLCSSFCSTPPFLTTSVPANVLFVIDKSGSMGWSAYNPDSSNKEWCDNSWGCGWSLNGTEEGYFIPTKSYIVIGGCDSSNYWNCHWQETATAHKPCPYTWMDVYDNSGPYSGACLNFLLMSRMDLFRWAVTGGRPEPCSDGSYTSSNCDPNLVCTGAWCRLETAYSDKVDVPVSRLDGITQQFEVYDNRPRFGALFYDTSIESAKVYIGDYPNGGNADGSHPYTYLKRYINAMEPDGGTGSAIAMWEAYDYFKQQNAHNYGNGFSISTSSTRYRDPLYICDASRSNCSPAPCMKNFVILVSDGQWNYGGSPTNWTCTIDKGYENYSADPVVPAYKMHSAVLRQLSGTDINVYDVYALGLFLGGSGELSLKNVAMYGSFDTTSKTWPDGLSGYPQAQCYMDDCGNGKGSACTSLPASSADWDSDADNMPDTFLNAQNAKTIKDSLLSFLSDIQQKSSAGSSVSILATKAKKGNLMAQAVFYPQRQFGSNTVNWTGYLNTFWFLNTHTAQNIREDTVNATFLDLYGDYIIDFVLNSSGNLLIDAYSSASNGTISSYSAQYSSLDDVHKVWEAGGALNVTSPSARKIKYAFSNAEWREFNATNISGNVSGIKPFLGSDLSQFPGCLGTSLSAAYSNLVAYIRGEDVSSCRRRTVGGGNIWKLGDIVYSTPLLVDYNDYSMLYVGANDGMLHAFRAGKLRTDGLGPDQIVRLCDNSTSPCSISRLGREEWAFIPKNVMPYLRYLADPNYCHIYFVDLSPYIIKEDTDSDGYIDKRILIGGMRFGGGCGCSGADCVNPPADTCPDPSSEDCVGLSSYYALDITDADSPHFLWEFSHPKLGFSYSGPAYIKRAGQRFIMFVSGPTDYDGTAGLDLKIFVLKLNSDFTLSTVYKFDGNGFGGFIKKNSLTSYNNAFGGRLFTNGIDYDDDGSTDAVFFGVSQKTGSSWQGNIIGILTDFVNPALWAIETVFNRAREPVTSKVVHMKCFNMNYIYFGTGRWFYKMDEPGTSSSDKEKLYGIRIDECLQEGSGHCSLNSAYSASDTCRLLDSGTVQNISWVVDDLLPKDATFFKERTITDPTVSDYNAIFFTTMQPSADICQFGGRSRVWALNCATGGNITSTCENKYILTDVGGSLMLQLSRGNIEPIAVRPESFTNDAGQNSPWMVGVPPESSTPLAGGSPGSTGEIILWMER